MKEVMSKIVIQCTECGEHRESEKGVADVDHEGCEETHHGIHLWTARADLSEWEDSGEDGEETTDWRSTHSDELKRQRGLNQINGVLWTSEQEV